MKTWMKIVGFWNSWIGFFLFGFPLLMGIVSCEYEHYPEPPLPKVAKETDNLEASYTPAAPNTLTASYWKNANWKKISPKDISTSKLYTDGMLKMTGTYNGKSDFNGGTATEVTMKAAYDEQKLYIMVEWTDNDYSPMKANSFWDSKADPLKPDSAGEWTSQGNSDKFALAFDINGASGSGGTFSAAGCAAACHSNSNAGMQTSAGKADLWCWDMAVSEPLGYARDMVMDASSGIKEDAGQPLFVRNKTDIGNNRSAPAYEYNGTDQSVTGTDGKSLKLDPAYFLLNKTPFTGDPMQGRLVFHNDVYGCNHCHGEEGEGDVGPSFISAVPNRRSRSQMMDYAASHEGGSYYLQVPSAERDNLMAYIRGLGGIPGYYLNPPDGSNGDIRTISNLKLTVVDVLKTNAKYQVLFIRNLVTGKEDDVQFSGPEGKEFSFGLALMDADGKNHIGSNKEVLKFMNKE